MNSRPISIILLALNVGLLATIGYMAYLMQTAPVVVRSDNVSRVVTNTQIAVRKVYPTNFLANLGKLRMSWNAIESTNYHIYVANLRAIDCPVETIRDIILTDVAKLFAKRRAALRSQGAPYKFWQAGEAWENAPATSPALRKQLQDLEREQRDLVRELLDVDLQTELGKYWSGDDEQERMYGFLPPDKRQRVLEAQTKYDEMEQEIYSSSKGVMLDEDQEKLKKIQKQREAELAGLLSPEEFEEYELRNSPTANGLRSQMSGFEATEEEFRKLFRLQKVFDNEFNQAFDSTDDAQAGIKARAQTDAQEALNAEIKKTLGEARYNEWVRAQDGDYKALAQVADRFELPKETANKIYDMKQEAERQKQKIDSNQGLSYDQRLNALAAIARETEKSVALAMGDKVFRAYQKTGGQWIQNLGASAVPPPEQEPAAAGRPVPPLPFPLTFPGVVPPPPK